MLRLCVFRLWWKTGMLAAAATLMLTTAEVGPVTVRLLTVIPAPKLAVVLP